MSRTSAFPLIVLLFLLSSVSFSVHGCPPYELKALLEFKSTINDTSPYTGIKLNSWNGHDCCEWIGVECQGTQVGRRVSKLDLRGFLLKSVSRKIYSSLSELDHLKYLDLNGNFFPGEIPSEFGKLSSLRHLDLALHCDAYYGNDYTCISYNFTSSYLQWLSNFSSLEYLSLSGVKVCDKSWESITDGHEYLEYLDLSHNDISGSIPSTIGNLTGLEYLDLFDSDISGSIPSTIVNLKGLEYLDLSWNNISGSIPSTIGNLTRLEHLDLSRNPISGSIPSTIGNLTCLEYLRLSYNALTGQIPSSLCLLINLTSLILGPNQLTGNIPSSLGNLHKLRELYLFGNHLSGSLPLSVFHLSSLTVLDVSENRLNGSIPSTVMLPSSLRALLLANNNMNGKITEVFFQRCSRLSFLNLSQSGLSMNISSTWIPSFQLSTLFLKKCQIGGPIPGWISTQFSLGRLDLSANQLVGNLPSWLWDIIEVHLSDNHLQGSFIPTSGPLRFLDLSMNELSGGLQADIHVHLSNAEVLMLADNKFEGQIPTSIANLTRLRFLDMSNNSLTGNVPATLGNLTLLEGLNLENNYLEGEIPKELGSLSRLQFLRIGKNSLQGVLPLSLTKISGLQVLDVGGNNLIGNIPHWIANFSSLRVLVMRSNNFRGILPRDIGRMPQLQVLDLSSNFFSGAIPHSYFRLPAIQNSSADGQVLSSSYASQGDLHYSISLIVKGQELQYEYIYSSFKCFDLSNNRLTGHLLPEIENLKGLMYFNLSWNSLSGPIPESVGNLVQLESVDLSFNKFSGRIPSQIGNLTYLARLNLSFNDLCGRIPEQGGQMVTFDKWSYIGNPNLWGCPLERNCSRRVLGASPPPVVGVDENSEGGFQFPWYEMCLGLSWGLGFAAVVMVLVLKHSWRKKYFEMMDRVIWMLDRVIWMLPNPKPKPNPVRG